MLGPAANGTLGAWTAGPVLPVPRANHASAVVGADLLVLGGNHQPTPGGPFVAIDLIHAAAIGADGTLGAWREVGRLPSPVTEHAAAAWGDKLLVIDGIYDNVDDSRQVWSAQRQADGSIGVFVSLGTMPDELRAISAEAWVADDTLYVTSGQLPPEGDTLLLLAAPLGTAAPLVWTTMQIAPSPAFRGQAQHVFTGTSIHALGGYQGPTAAVIAATTWARVDRNVATPAGAGPALLAPTAAGEAIAVDDFAFLIGGKPFALNGTGVVDTSVATIGDDGALGAWTASTALPVGRTNHDLALGPTHLYLSGGALDGGGLDTVFFAQVRFPRE